MPHDDKSEGADLVLVVCVADRADCKEGHIIAPSLLTLMLCLLVLVPTRLSGGRLTVYSLLHVYSSF